MDRRNKLVEPCTAPDVASTLVPKRASWIQQSNTVCTHSIICWCLKLKSTSNFFDRDGLWSLSKLNVRDRRLRFVLWKWMKRYFHGNLRYCCGWFTLDDNLKIECKTFTGKKCVNTGFLFLRFLALTWSVKSESFWPTSNKAILYQMPHTAVFVQSKNFLFTQAEQDRQVLRLA